MKIKNIDLIMFSNILDEYITKRLPQKISYAITKNIFAIENEMKIYRQMLENIVNAYADYQVKDSDGNVVMLPTGIPKVNEDYMDKYVKEINDLLATEIEIDLYHVDDSVFDYEDSDRYDALSPKDMINLRRILCN